MNKACLLHSSHCFERETLLQRQQEFGFQNLPRLETFLWNLEIFLHLQHILGNCVALKGGAAVQLHLPIHYQRTSVDIDMVCSLGVDEIEEALRKAEDGLGAEDELFRFRRYMPNDPKTGLPLLTYKMLYPTVCSPRELRNNQNMGLREMKIEFFITSHMNFQVIEAPQVFALETDHSYQVLSLDALLGDKLTTLGPNTVGIPDNRSDEQMKQIYDIDSLVAARSKEFYFANVKAEFYRRAEEEAVIRSIIFDPTILRKDIADQMARLSRVDIDGNQYLKNLINNFQSLYLSATARRTNADWAITGARIALLVECILANQTDTFFSACDLSKTLHFNTVADPLQRGKILQQFQADFSAAFAGSQAEAKILKGKKPERIFWAVVSSESCSRIGHWINSFFKSII